MEIQLGDASQCISKEIDDRDEGSFDTFRSILSEEQVSDEHLDEFIRSVSERMESNCQNCNENEHGYVHQVLNYSYNYYVDDCDKITSL